MQMLVKDIVKACNGVLLCGDPETGLNKNIFIK